MQQELYALEETFLFPKPSLGNLAYMTPNPSASILERLASLNIAYISTIVFYMQSCC